MAVREIFWGALGCGSPQGAFLGCSKWRGWPWGNLLECPEGVDRGCLSKVTCENGLSWRSFSGMPGMCNMLLACQEERRVAPRSLRCCLSGDYPGEPFWDALIRKG